MVDRLVSKFLAEILAPGTPAPEASVMVPDRVVSGGLCVHGLRRHEKENESSHTKGDFSRSRRHRASPVGLDVPSLLDML
jgi:hypothetical protein